MTIVQGDHLIYAGPHLAAEWYCAADGKMPAFEYYQELSEVDQERFDVMIKYLCDSPVGTLLPKTLYRIEDKKHKIYALKSRDERFFNFAVVGAKIIVTNAYHKHSQKMTKQDIECLNIAVRYKQDYEKRVQEGCYYEKK